MTYWAREDPDGPWLESEVLVGASAFELRPLAGPVPSRSIPFAALARVEELSTGADPSGRTIRVASTDGSAVLVRGPVNGMSALIGALGAARTAAAARPPAPLPAHVEPPAAPDPVQRATPDEAPAPEAVGTVALAAVAVGAGDDGTDEAADEPRGSSPLRLVPVAIGVLAFIIALGVWNYRSNQQDLREDDGRRVGHEDAEAPSTSAPGTTVPVQVEGATTVRPSTTTTTTPAPTTTRAPSTTTTVPTTTTRPPAAPAGPRTLSGTVALQQLQQWTGIAPACRGLGALSDVSIGSTVTVQDGSGRTIATGTLGACTFVVPGSELSDGAPVVARDGAAGGYPRFDFQIAGVPETDRYSVKVGRYDPVSLRRQDFGSGPWRMRMVITAT
jgi:hypothetical protein